MIAAFLFLSFIKSVFLNAIIVSKGNDHNFTNFKTGMEYEYYTDCQSGKKVTITLIMKYIDSRPFNSFSVYEKYYKSGSNQIYYQNINPQITTKNNELIIIYSFISKTLDTRYVGILFKLNYNCNYIKMRFDIEDPSPEDLEDPVCKDKSKFSFELEYGVPKNFTNLSACNYYFYIKCKQSQTVDISFTMNAYFNIQWTIYEVKEIFGSNITNKIVEPKIRIESNNAILSYSYKCTNLETKYIKIEISLASNTKYIVGLITSKGDSYYLDNAVPKTINYFNKGLTYFLFLNKAKFGQKVNINLSIKSINGTLFKQTYIAEYSSKSTVNKYNISPESKSEKNNLLNLLFSFTINSEDTSSFALCLTPNYDMDSITAKIEAKFIFYNFINGIPQNITNLIAPFPYFFYINAKQNQQSIITLEMNINDQFHLDAYEYENLDFIYNNNIRSSLNLKYITNSKKVDYTYSIISSNVKYISFSIRPNTNINNLFIKIEVGGETFNLNNGIPINGLNLTARFPYTFYINIKQYQKANFILSIDNDNKTYLNGIIINESNTYNYIPKIKIEGNKKLISASHVLLSNFKNNISFYINPISNIYKSSVIINVGGESFDLENGASKIIKNLKAGYPYIFFLSTNQYQSLNINLKVNNINKNPFDIITIQELNSKTIPSSNFINKQPNISVINNNTIISLSNLVTNSKYLVLNATPIIDINYLEINTELEGGNFECSNGFIKNFYNIKSGYSYYFFINIKQYENSSFILTMENTNSNPFDLVLCECDIYNRISKNYTESFKTKIENNKLVLHYSYFSKISKRVAFHIISKCNINNLNVKINNGGGYYSLSNSYNYYRNIISGKSYYFSLNTPLNNYYSNQIVNILFVMNYVNDNQISQIQIYEYSSLNTLSSLNQYTIDYIPSIKRENNNIKELISIYSYKVKSYLTQYVVFQITPNYDIDNININYNFNSDDNKNSSPFAIGISWFFIALPLLIIIILTAFFIHKDDILKSRNQRNDSSLI